MVRILVVLRASLRDTFLNEHAKGLLAELAPTHFEFFDDAAGRRMDEAAYIALLQRLQPEIVVTAWQSPQFTPAVQKACPSVKYICHLCGTLKAITTAEAIRNGVLVSNWGDVIARTIAEATLMMMLAGLRRVAAFQHLLHEEKGWAHDGIACASLFERRVGLYGMGPIAMKTVELLKPFGCKISGFSRHAPHAQFVENDIHPAHSLEALFEHSQVLSIHTGWNKETEKSVTADLLRRLPDGALVVNTARGQIVDEPALAAELKTGRIFAALDVFSEEPLPADSPLRGLPNCLLMPHVAGPTPDRLPDLGAHCVRQLATYLRGGKPLYTVSAEQYERAT
ncbi:MAG: hydroxyacid dehydrogenase [Planctomycetota bacterium]